MSYLKRFCVMFCKILAAAAGKMLRNETTRDAAGISYFVLMSLFPAILVIIAIADSFLGWMSLNTTVIEIIIGLFPGSNQFIRSNLDEITTPSTTGIVSCVILVLWTASWIFSFVESSINRAWDIPNQRTFWESRLRTVALMTLGSVSLFGMAAFTTFVRIARARAATNSYFENLPGSVYLMGWFWYYLLLATGVMVTIFILALIYKWTPHCKVFWKEAFSGAVVAAAMLEFAGHIFMRLVPLFDYQQVYGRMGTVVALLAWIYTSIMIVLFGANFGAQMHWIRSEMTGPLYFAEKR
ncbi:MAG: YihY/virulence factor BrkB family protein [Acidobacteriota bacterium]|jgi:membrane protein|nr:YihY/virulence factor BrkB family protein [Acidobacteriota bacterium]